MADVKIHECFPTMISEFSFNPDKMTQVQMIGYIKEVKENQKETKENRRFIFLL